MNIPFIIFNLTNDYTLNFFFSIFANLTIPVIFSFLILKLFLGNNND